MYKSNLGKCKKYKERRTDMKRLPESELEIMMIIWKYDRPVNRMEIE